jgi:hypothetical protein
VRFSIVWFIRKSECLNFQAEGGAVEARKIGQPDFTIGGARRLRRFSVKTISGMIGFVSRNFVS